MYDTIKLVVTIAFFVLVAIAIISAIVKKKKQ